MGKFLDWFVGKFIEWAGQKRRWPLLVPPGFGVLLFSFTKLYFELSFRDTVQSAAFLIGIAISLVSSGVLYVLVAYRRTRERFIVCALMIVLAAMPLGLAWHWNAPRPLPNNELVVGLTLFEPLGDVEDGDVAGFRDRLEKALEEKRQMGVPLRSKLIDRIVVGATQESRRQNALELCNQRGSEAHVLLWGQIRRDEQELALFPRITIAGTFAGRRLESREVRDYLSDLQEPDYLELKKSAASDMADLVSLILALAYYNEGEWDQSADLFRLVPSPEGQSFLAVSLIYRAEASVEPHDDLVEAAVVLRRVASSDAGISSPELLAMTQNNLGTVLLRLGEHSEGEDAAKYLKQAVEAYEHAEEVSPREQVPQGWAATQMNLGNILAALGKRSEGEEAAKYLKQAVRAYENALEVYTRDQLPQDWAMTQNNLGNVLKILGKHVEGKEAVDYLKQSVQAFQSALEVYSREQIPQGWAGTQNNLGNVLASLGEHAEGEEAAKHLKQSVQAYEHALEVRTRGQLPQDWAATQNNLGGVLLRLGERSEGEESAVYLKQSVEAFDNAQQVYSREQHPQNWAMTQNNLGLVLSTLGERSEGEEAPNYLKQAVQAYENALEVYTRKQFPQGWATTKNNLGLVLSHLGERSEGEEAAEYLDQSVQAYEHALEVRTREHLPQGWAATQNNLGIVLMRLGESSEGEEAVSYLKQAVQAYESALGVYTRESNPHAHALVTENLERAQDQLETL